jgi:DNA-binding NarL/FixJ family response regulator/tetratricopeptide (TPR) repeat protein
VPRVLLAEPHDATRAAVHAALSARGHEVLMAADPRGLADLYAVHRPDAVVLAADLPDVEELTRKLRKVDPRLLLVVADKEHLGQALGIQAVLPLRANAYVADATGPELTEKLTLLLSQQAAARARLRGVPLLLSRAPAAQGEIRPGVVARLVHQIWRSLSEGALVLSGPGLERRIFFQRGVPVAVESESPAEALAGWLEEAGRLDEEARRAAEDFMAGGLTPGAALIAAGVLEPGEPLQAALRAHLRALLVRSVGAREGAWRFHAGDEFSAQIQLADVLPLPPLLDGAREHLPVKHFADALKAVLQAYPTRTADFELLVPAIGLGAMDLHLARVLDGQTPTRTVLEANKADLKQALSLLWFLSMIGAVVFHDAPEAAASGGPAAGATPRARPELPADRAEAIRQAALRILPGTYFHALGVDIATDAGEVERAYREVMARFDPAAFADYEVGDLADLLRSVQDKVTAAHRVLSSDEKRRHYLSFLLLKAELSGARSPGIVLEAEVAMKRGERALRARRNAEAVSALHEAVEHNPREPEYLAMLGFAELHDPVLPANARAAEARGRAKAALELDSGHLRSMVVLALAEELAGHRDAARAAIDGALRAHPYSELARRVHLRLLRPART